MTEESHIEFQERRKREEYAKQYEALPAEQRRTFERMLEWRKVESRHYDALSPSQRMSLGYYELTKQAAKAEGKV